MARPRDPTALKALKNKSHMTNDEKDRVYSEIYASEGEIEVPDYLEGNRAITKFKKEAAYMKRVNAAAGVPVYGDTDIEALAIMVMSYYKYLQYQSKEIAARDVNDRQKYNSMKNKEAMIYERFMKMLKLDPSSRVDFSNSSGDDADEFDM